MIPLMVSPSSTQYDVPPSRYVAMLTKLGTSPGWLRTVIGLPAVPLWPAVVNSGCPVYVPPRQCSVSPADACDTNLAMVRHGLPMVPRFESLPVGEM